MNSQGRSKSPHLKSKDNSIRGSLTTSEMNLSARKVDTSSPIFELKGLQNSNNSGYHHESVGSPSSRSNIQLRHPNDTSGIFET